jgi:lipopolysaccharide biosynthesis regulator YciM
MIMLYNNQIDAVEVAKQQVREAEIAYEIANDDLHQCRILLKNFYSEHSSLPESLRRKFIRTSRTTTAEELNRRVQILNQKLVILKQRIEDAVENLKKIEAQNPKENYD